MNLFTPLCTLAAITASFAGCSYNPSSIHLDQSPVAFDENARAKFPKSTPRNLVLQTCKREGLHVERIKPIKTDTPLEALIQPSGLIATWGYAGAGWGHLEFHFNEHDQLVMLIYREPPHSRNVMAGPSRTIEWTEKTP